MPLNLFFLRQNPKILRHFPQPFPHYSHVPRHNQPQGTKNPQDSLTSETCGRVFRIATFGLSAYCTQFLINDVSAWRNPVADVMKAFALPKFKFMSRRMGKWFSSSEM